MKRTGGTSGRRLVVAWVACCVTVLTGAAAGLVGSPALAAPPAEKTVIPKALGYSLTPSKTEPYAVCPPATKNREQCMSIVVPGAAEVESEEVEYLVGHGGPPPFVPNLEGGGEEGGFSPSDLRSAYNLPEAGGVGQTVAIVDAYDDPHAEADLNVYRSHYKLSYKETNSECTKANGCFEKVNQLGETEPKAWPASSQKWAPEISLDIEMVSAICPQCKILLVEANNAEKVNLLTAEEEAVKLKATEVSNSWGGPEEPSETEDDKDFNHGIPITVSAGDSGYGAQYPAASPDVISVGGTALVKSSGTRGWSEETWFGTGSGCSADETTKPSWQPSEPGCSHRIDNDVSAVASPWTPVSVYDSYFEPGWLLLGGTSVSSPIVAGVEALSSSTFRSEGPQAFYKAQQGSLFDVAAGNDGTCTPPSEDEYLCAAGLGYDGPTGNGTPDFNLNGASSVVTGPATSFEVSGAKLATKLTGSVNPKGLETHYRFEYGPTTSYGTRVPAKESEEPSAGSGTSAQHVSLSVTGLQRETTYHYRLVARSTAGTTYGEDRAFTTAYWTAQSPPNPTDGPPPIYFDGAHLNSVSCSSTTACIAVGTWTELIVTGELEGIQTGEYRSWPLAERWNGTSWSLEYNHTSQSIPLPLNTKEMGLNAVSCSSASACTAVGWYTEAYGSGVGLVRPVVERWNGSAWSPQAAPDPKSGEQEASATLIGVSCQTSSWCVAVGHYRYGSGQRLPLAEVWQSWEERAPEWRVDSPGYPEKTVEVGLSAISCSSVSACTAVGNASREGSINHEVPFAERWTGTAWATQLMPTPGKAGTERFTVLTGVSCPSSSRCVAVGYSGPLHEGREGKVEEMFAEQWEGAEWSIQTVPGPNSSENAALDGVSCPSATACTAVGSYSLASDDDLALTEHWNGAEWTARPSPYSSSNPPYLLQEMLSVFCASVEACMAVGVNTNATNVTYAESYAGPPPPTAATESATPVGTLSATVSGTLNPEGTDAHYSFEYGTTTAYGSKVATADAGAGTTNVKVSDSLNALGPNTTYHYRLVATNAVATTYGPDHELHTLGSEWRQAGEPLSAAVGTKSKGTVKLTDEGTGVGMECEAAGEGPVGVGAVDEDTKVTMSKCHTVSGTCESPGMEAANLPWHSELTLSSGSVYDVIATGGKGAPGYRFICTVGGIAKTTDECTGTTLKTGMTNVTGGVDAAFDGENLNRHRWRHRQGRAHGHPVYRSHQRWKA